MSCEWKQHYCFSTYRKPQQQKRGRIGIYESDLKVTLFEDYTDGDSQQEISEDLIVISEKHGVLCHKSKVLKATKFFRDYSNIFVKWKRLIHI